MSIAYFSSAGAPYALFDPRELPPLNERRAAEVVRALAEAVPTGLPYDSEAGRRARDRLEAAIRIALQRELGTWAIGFSWSRFDEGLAQEYCCSGHSLLPEGEPSPDDTVRRVVGAVARWRAQLEVIDSMLEDIARRVEALPLPAQLEHAAAALLPYCLEQTRAEECWYNALSQLLRWYVDRIGGDGGRLAPTIADALSGVFGSWTTPSEAERESGAAAVRQALETGVPEAPTDGLEAWVRTRVHPPPRGRITPAQTLAFDSHLEFVASRDAARDPDRADRMRRAILACRHAATRSLPLTLTLLTEWQTIVLGGPAPFRCGPAFAKQGREHYGFDARTQPRFERWLAEAQRKKPSVFWRAARLYLDICFTHPFEDGNARCARLALDYLLTRSGRTLQIAEPVFCLSRAPDDRYALQGLAYILASTSGVTDD